MMADYNGWTDEREEEREALNQLDVTPTAGPSRQRNLPRLRGVLLHAAVQEILARSTT